MTFNRVLEAQIMGEDASKPSYDVLTTRDPIVEREFCIPKESQGQHLCSGSELMQSKISKAYCKQDG